MRSSLFIHNKPSTENFLFTSRILSAVLVESRDKIFITSSFGRSSKVGISDPCSYS